MPLPLIDLSLYTNGSPEDRQSFCDQLREHCGSGGFVRLINHGVSDEKVATIFDWSRRFFELSDEAKAKAARPMQGPNRGWAAVGQEKLSGITGAVRGAKAPLILKDIKESFDLGAHNDTLFPTPWPSEDDIPGFRPFMQSFYDDCHIIHLRLLSILEEALGLEHTRLTSLCSDGNAELRTTHYPPIGVKLMKSGTTVRIAEHTDVGTFTLLFQDSVGGLEIEDQEKPGSFLPIQNYSNTEMIVNVGDTLQRWTNELLCSANHRVTIPTEMQSLSDGLIPARISVGYFGKANRDISLSPLKEFLGSSPSRFETEVNSQDYYTGIHERSYPAAVKTALAY